jgi:hypothetical protein
MATGTIRDIVSTVMITLTVACFCIGLLPVAQAQYDIPMLRTYFNCPECDVSSCKNPIGCELVKEPGFCGCCMTCARREGEPCGIGQEKCGQGLTCSPPLNAINGLEALMNGKGICEPRRGE